MRARFLHGIMPGQRALASALVGSAPADAGPRRNTCAGIDGRSLWQRAEPERSERRPDAILVTVPPIRGSALRVGRGLGARRPPADGLQRCRRRGRSQLWCRWQLRRRWQLWHGCQFRHSRQLFHRRQVRRHSAQDRGTDHPADCLRRGGRARCRPARCHRARSRGVVDGDIARYGIICGRTGGVDSGAGSGLPRRTRSYLRAARCSSGDWPTRGSDRPDARRDRGRAEEAGCARHRRR